MGLPRRKRHESPACLDPASAESPAGGMAGAKLPFTCRYIFQREPS
jgi:hypothetical protein